MGEKHRDGRKGARRQGGEPDKRGEHRSGDSAWQKKIQIGKFSHNQSAHCLALLHAVPWIASALKLPQ